MTRFLSTLILTGACASLVLSCGGGDSGVSAAAKAKGEEIFATVCSTCHGKSGLGDGPGAAALDPKPRNYTDKEWQASVTDQHIKDIIVQGGAAMGLSTGMPAHPQFANDPEALDGLVWKVRSFAR
ncbi:MAG: cytochrome c [Planctomycetota bacterium]|nr:MAG: cytochrome c [Planctomycetota bacterium]